VDPITIAAAAAGYQVARKSIKAVNEALKTANDVKDIGHALESLFHHLDAPGEEKGKEKKKKSFSKLHKSLSAETHEDLDDSTSLAASAEAVLQRKKLERSMQNLATRIDNKFGEFTWREILDERERRVQEKAEREKKKKEEDKLDRIYTEESVSVTHKILIEGTKIVGLLVFAGGIIFFFMTYSR